MTPEPPVIEETLARMKLPRTPVMVRASPAVAVEVSMVEYCASGSTIAVCSAKLKADGAVPKIVRQRTVRPFSGNPVCGSYWRGAGWFDKIKFTPSAAFSFTVRCRSSRSAGMLFSPP
jgi:hypothetical protein